MYRIEADTFMDVGVQGMAEFALRLKGLYETLTGEARLEEPYSVHNYIEFIAETGGHIRVMGRLNNKSAFGCTQEIHFENEIDQTYLRDFVNRLLADFGRHAECKFLNAGISIDHDLLIQRKIMQIRITHKLIV